MPTRREFLAAAAPTLGMAACARKKASGYSGLAFIANQEGEAVAAVDLNVFAVAKHIRLQGKPTAVIAHPHLPLAYALTPENATLHEINADTLAFSRKASVASTAQSMRLTPDARFLFVLCRQPRALVRFALSTFRPDSQIPLPADPLDFEISPNGALVAVSYQTDHAISLFPAAADKPGPPIQTTGDIGALRFLSDSKTLIAANRGQRQLALYQTATRQVIANLPLAVRPDNLCFNSDGGQLFITGEGTDGVVVVYPYYTPYVAETVLAGHAPGVMAATLSPNVSPQYLFIANPNSGDVSVMNITKRRVISVTPVGSGPTHIAITPDDQYALVLNQGSGDIAVIRILNITRAATDSTIKRSRKAPLFMMVPVGSKPVSAAIMPI